ncbi:MAG: hypothetical protein CENE_02465 [Candidatus Celerinatantimonas neptuna]|nr:MAG: hypothetical protein CENE_02465 [Candidatus Celerinatantimonas neptuna]
MDDERKTQLLSQLIPLHQEPDFPQIFLRMTQDESKNDQFLLKMELNRLTAPTQRVIDLRGKVDGKCREYPHEEIIHYLDDIGIRTFKNLLEQYGHYALGVFEAMQHTQNNLRELRNNPHPPQLPQVRTQIKALQFGYYHDRVEERVYISLPIEIENSDGARCPGMSSNMSLSGIKIRFDHDEAPNIGESLTIYFTGLEKLFANEVLSRGTKYRVLDYQSNDKGLWIRLKLIKLDDEFNQFFKKFLNAYKGRYRVDVIHLLDAIITKSYQQFFLPRSASLPLYFKGEAPPVLHYVLRNDNNQTTLAYWRNEHHQNLLGQLFHKPRMTRISLHDSGKTLIYSFIHSYNRQLYFYSATHDELMEYPALRELFFHFGSGKISWRIFEFQWQRINLSHAFPPQIIPNQPQSFDEKIIKEQLSCLSFMGLLTDITNEHHSAYYHQRFQSDLNPNELAPFGQYRYPIPDINIVAHKYLQLRKETRYQYRSLAEVSKGIKSEIGWITNFSPGGMKIELDNPLPVQTGDEILISLPQFQKLVKTYRLDKLPYRIVNLQNSRQTVHLQALTEQHEGRRFFTQLIANNMDKLDQTPEIHAMEGLSEALRNLYCHELCKHVLYINKEGSRLKLRALAYGEAQSPLDEILCLSREQHSADLTSLMRQEQWHDWLFKPLKALPQEGALSFRLLLALHRKNKQVIAVRRECDFTSRDEVALFVQQALENGSFRYLELKAYRVNRPDTDYIQNEMDYVTHYAIHRAKELEDELWHIFSVVEINDITNEWLALQL